MEKLSGKKFKNVMNHNLHQLFIVLLVASIALSFYFFMHVTILNEVKHKSIFSNWQFPMLLAVLLDVLYEP